MESLTSSPRLAPEGHRELDSLLQEAAKILPGTFFTVVSSQETLYSNQCGLTDVLDPTQGQVTPNTIAWFASTTKILTSIAALQLIDKGLLTLSTPVHDPWLPELAPPLKILKSFDSQAQPIFHSGDGAVVTVEMLMNQTGGVGGESSPLIKQWKGWTSIGGGYVNSCQEVNLVNTPLVSEPGTEWHYGNAAEWLGLLVSRATKMDLEDYFQQFICKPLGLTSTSFYPFSKADLASYLMPLRYWNKDTGIYEEHTNQLELLLLPRSRDEIQYCVGGGGVYTTAQEWGKVCQHILSNLQQWSPACILSEASLKSLFEPTLTAQAKRNLCNGMLRSLWSEYLDWSTGMCLYTGAAPREGWGRRPGSGFWMGAAGSEVWIDPSAGIACVFTTNLLPQLDPRVMELGKKLEAAVYRNLVDSQPNEHRE